MDIEVPDEAQDRDEVGVLDEQAFPDRSTGRRDDDVHLVRVGRQRTGFLDADKVALAFVDVDDFLPCH